MASICDFLDDRLTWLHHPSSWGVEDPTGDAEGSQGSASVAPDGQSLVIVPPAFKDFWRRTYYSPLLIKGDASALVATVGVGEECTVQVDFVLDARGQFDQGGLLVFVDALHWVKCGIEYCDGIPRLSCVVCNVFSDWSTQPWPSLGARLRVHKVLQSSTIVVEAAPLDSDEFHFFRIAHLSAMASHGGADVAAEPEARGASAEQPWRVGPFAACPMAQRGFSARFTKFSIGPRMQSVHSGDASEMV